MNIQHTLPAQVRDLTKTQSWGIAGNANSPQTAAQGKQLPWRWPARPQRVGPKAAQAFTAETRDREELRAMTSPARKSRNSAASLCAECPWRPGKIRTRCTHTTGSQESQALFRLEQGRRFTTCPSLPASAPQAWRGQLQQLRVLSLQPVSCCGLGRGSFDTKSNLKRELLSGTIHPHFGIETCFIPKSRSFK